MTRTTPLSMNDRSHWRVKAREVADLRKEAYWLALEARIPRLEHAEVVLTYFPRDKRRRDPINIAATLKPVQDGLVDANVVPDDTPEFMTSPMPVIGKPTGVAGRLVVTVTGVPA